MKVLAVDTATERCSVALWSEGQSLERGTDTSRGHADLVLPMVAEVLAEAGITLRELDGIAFGCGPGGFTGVRIAVSVTQGLAFAAELPVVGISNLAAVAQQVGRPGDQVLVCMDARMEQVYCGRFERAPGSAHVVAVSAERVLAPAEVERGAASLLAGTGLRAYSQLASAWPDLMQCADVLPHAREIALLGLAALKAGAGVPAWEAQPVYLRDAVAWRS
jgi:tRNA threonylcarbamoyladenosine biosynthesis protein TsaB